MKKINHNIMRKLVLNTLYAALVLTISSCNTESEPTNLTSDRTDQLSANTYNLTSTQFSSSGMQLGKLKEMPFHEIVKATGMFDVPPENRASISTYFGGTVNSIKLLSGERVKKGQLLFNLENPDYVQLQQDYLETKGQLLYLKSDYERQLNLVQDSVTSQKKYLQAESAYTVMQVKFESLRKKLELMGINPNTLTVNNIQTTINIISPIDGYITSVNISRGGYLNPSQTALSIVNTDHLHLELNIFEKDILKVNVGQPISFKLQNDAAKEYQATVHLVNKTVDSKDRTVGIHGHLTDDKLTSRFNPGVYVEAEIFTTSELKSALPQNALVEVDDKYYVLELATSSNDSYLFNKREVRPGLSYNGYVEILNFQDFPENSEILINGSFNLITE
jgi:cobalt-zinc-cadmium efflux system membrane fusion protein